MLNELIKVKVNCTFEGKNKYRLLFQSTEPEHNDRKDLLEAVTLMADVAAFINESKRRKDIGGWKLIIASLSVVRSLVLGQYYTRIRDILRQSSLAHAEVVSLKAYIFWTFDYNMFCHFCEISAPLDNFSEVSDSWRYIRKTIST